MINDPAKVIADCAEMRDGQRPDMTVAEAIAQAQWVRRTPDGVLSPAIAKQTMEALLSALEASPCYFKGARLGIPTFTLLAYDRAGHLAIGEWIKQASAHGCRPEKVADASARLAEFMQRTDCSWPT